MSTNNNTIKPCYYEKIEENSNEFDEMNERCSIALLDTKYNIQVKENNLKSLNTNTYTIHTNNSPDDKICKKKKRTSSLHENNKLSSKYFEPISKISAYYEINKKEDNNKIRINKSPSRDLKKKSNLSCANISNITKQNKTLDVTIEASCVNCENCKSMKKKIIKFSKEKMDLNIELINVKKELSNKIEEYLILEKKFNEKLKIHEKDVQYILKQEKEISRLQSIIEKNPSQRKPIETRFTNRATLNSDSHTNFKKCSLYDHYLKDFSKQSSIKESEIIKEGDISDYFKVLK